MDYEKDIASVYDDVLTKHIGEPVTPHTAEQLKREMDAEFHARGIPASIVSLEWNPLFRSFKASVSVSQILEITAERGCGSDGDDEGV